MKSAPYQMDVSAFRIITIRNTLVIIRLDKKGSKKQKELFKNFPIVFILLGLLNVFLVRKTNFSSC
jgi:hypothetical protein